MPMIYVTGSRTMHEVHVVVAELWSTQCEMYSHSLSCVAIGSNPCSRTVNG